MELIARITKLAKEISDTNTDACLLEIIMLEQGIDHTLLTESEKVCIEDKIESLRIASK